jgi:hypothetical protein
VEVEVVLGPQILLQEMVGEVLIFLLRVVVVVVAFLRVTPQLLVVLVVLLVALQLRLVEEVLEVRQLVRQELLDQQDHLLLAEQAVVVAVQTMRALEAQVVQEVSPEVVEGVAVEEHPQAVLVAMVRLVV